MNGVPDGPAPDATVDGIRAASEDDLPRLLAIQAAAFPDPNRTLLRSGVRAGLSLVAVAGPGVPDGTTDGSADESGTDALVTAPAGYVLFTVDEVSVYVAELAVAPGHRRRGHGRRLLAAVAARHPDRERLRLTTRVDNERARAFYASLGFQEVRELPGHYGGSEPAAAGRADWSTADRRRSESRNAGDSTPDSDDADDPVDGVLLVRDLE